MKVLLLDNYDSFTYNLFHYLEALGMQVTVCFNDEIHFPDVEQYDRIVLSPGPGLPKDAGQMPELIQRFIHTKPILGVCLGFQAIVEYFGGQLYNQKEVKHGLAEQVHFDQKSRLFEGTSPIFQVGLYHSWAASRDFFPENLIITGRSETNVIMAFEHKELPVCGVQFHPESILTENGMKIIRNFIFNFQ